MRRFAHIVHPLAPGISADIDRAQPITFETLRRARDAASDKVSVDLLTAQFPDARAQVPPDFTATPDLERSARDLGSFNGGLSLACIADIIKRGFDASEADYLIFSGIDIALQPYFYTTLDKIISSGVDSCIINRRVISDEKCTVDDIDSMYAEIGDPHPGRDCFVFTRSAYRHFELGDALWGMPKVGALLALNQIYFSINFVEFRDLHMTFHLGKGSYWSKESYADYHAHNQAEWERVLGKFRERFPGKDHPMIERMNRSVGEKRRIQPDR